MGFSAYFSAKKLKKLFIHLIFCHQCARADGAVAAVLALRGFSAAVAVGLMGIFGMFLGYTLFIYIYARVGQNSADLGVRGKGMTSRMFCMPVTKRMSRSKPRPKPACGHEP